VDGCLELLHVKAHNYTMALELLFNILRGALCGKPYSRILTAKQLETVLNQAEEQAIFGLVFNAIQNAEIVDKEDSAGDEVGKAQMAIFEAVGLQEQIKQQNLLLNERAVLLSRIIASWNYKACVLKGQGVAQLYPEPLYRQSGDIDIWVDGTQDDIVSKLRDYFVGIRSIDYVHSNVAFFTDAEVEVHFRPSWMYNPFNNRKLQKFFSYNKKEQFDNIDKNVGFAYPTISFNLVYSLIHINRHIFEEGIGLRQLVDYYYILKHSTSEERKVAFSQLCRLSLMKFAAAIMYIEKEVLGIEDAFLLCTPDGKEGKFLLEEIMRGGNFGQHDSRNEWYDKDSRFKRGVFHLKRNWRYLKHYPSEVIWIPAWSIWHWCWRKWKGYL